MAAAQSSSLLSTKGRSMTTPALLTRTSIWPKASSARSRRRSASALTETSAWTTNAAPPPSLISPATASALSTLERQLTTTLAPSAAKRSATALPMPRELPVMMATLSLSLMLSSLACLPRLYRCQRAPRIAHRPRTVALGRGLR